MKAYSGKFYLLFVAGAILLYGCDNHRNEKRHPLFIKAAKLQHSGDYPAALLQYKRFLKVFPESPAAHKTLAAIYDDHLTQYLPALYHYERYLEYAPRSTDYNDMRKWRDAALRKYYLQARNQYNDPNDVMLLKKQNKLTMLKFKKSIAEQSKLINYIKKMKHDIASARNQIKQSKDKIIGLEIKLDTAKREYHNLQKKYNNISGELENLKKNQPETTPQKITDDIDNSSEEEKKQPKQADSDYDIKPIPSDELKNDPPPVSPTKNIPAEQSYIVQPGDTLSSISRKFYGKAKYYRRIMDANKSLIKGANSLRPGQILTIPNLNNDI